MPAEQPIRMQVYCRVEVLIHDPQAVIDLAEQDLREAEIDWSTEEDDLEAAVVELRANLPQSLATLANPERIFGDVPGLEVRGGRWWAGMQPKIRAAAAHDSDLQLSIAGPGFESLAAHLVVPR